MNVKLAPVSGMRLDKVTVCRDFIISRRLAMKLLLDGEIAYYAERHHAYPGYLRIGEGYNTEDGIFDRYFIKRSPNVNTFLFD